MRELHGLYALPSSLKLHWVGERCVEPCPLKVGRRKRLLWEHRLREHEGRPCKGQCPARLLSKQLVRKKESEVAGHQLPKAEELKRHPGRQLQQEPAVWLHVEQFEQT